MSSVEKDVDHNVYQNAATHSDIEDDEVTQDWSEAARLSKKTTQTSLPKRGEKDYEFDGTNVQDLLLCKARKAMFDTLYAATRGTVLSNQVKAYYIPVFEEAVVPQPRGNFMQTIGKIDTHGKCWLRLHEFVYLAERGTITPYYCKSFPILTENENQDFEIPLSMQDLYSLFKSQQDMDRYFIYAQLKRLGFIVNLKDQPPLENTSFFPPSQGSALKNMLCRMFHTMLNFWNHKKELSFNSVFYRNWGFLIRKYTSTPQMYQGLCRLIPFSKPPKSVEELIREKSVSAEDAANTNLRISFDVWKPQTNFKKKSPGLPDFQVVIHNKNISQQHFPTCSEFKTLFRSLDYKFDFLSEIKDDLSWNDYSYTNGILRSNHLASLKSKAVQMKSSVKNKMIKSKKSKSGGSRSPAAQQSKRLKSGYRSFLLAIMDGGLISFVKISEADFGSENVWYVSPTPNGNKGMKPE